MTASRETGQAKMFAAQSPLKRNGHLKGVVVKLVLINQ